KAARLQYLYLVGQRRRLHGALCKLEPPAGRAVGLRQHQRNVVACVTQRRVGNTGEFGSSGKDQAHEGIDGEGGKTARSWDVAGRVMGAEARDEAKRMRLRQRPGALACAAWS